MEKVSLLIVSKGIDHKGIVTNCGFVLGLTAGKLLPQETFGSDVVDGDGSTHTFLTNIGHYVREAGQSKLRVLREEFLHTSETIVVDYTEDAAPADYVEYAAVLKGHRGEEIVYRAIWVYGPTEAILPKTKNLSALQ